MRYFVAPHICCRIIEINYCMLCRMKSSLKRSIESDPFHCCTILFTWYRLKNSWFIKLKFILSIASYFSVVFARCFGARVGNSHISSMFASCLETTCLSNRFSFRLCSATAAIGHTRFRTSTISILGTSYNVDTLTNVTPRVANKVDRCLHRRPGHPLYHVRRRVENFFNLSFVKSGNPQFAVFDDLSPIVTPQQNFDSLLVPTSHPSRSPSDSYYINSEHLLRSHTTAHDADLIRSGLDSFLIIGDVYRRDEIDSSHYPVFHQIDGVHLFTENQVSLLTLFDTYFK